MAIAMEELHEDFAFPNRENDRRFFEELAAGDQARFEELVSRYIRLVFSTAFRLTKNQSEAEDIAQEVFLRIFRAIRSYDPSRPFLPWLYKITLNETYTRMRRGRRRNGIREEAACSEEPAVSSNFEETLAARELARRAEQIISELSPKQGIVLWLHDVAGVSAATLSRLLHVPVPTLKSRLHNGRILVRQRLSIRMGARPRSSSRSPSLAEKGHVTGPKVVERLVRDYLEGRLEAEDRACFEEQIRRCAECGPFLVSYVRKLGGLSPIPDPTMPLEMIHAVLAFLRESLENGRDLQRDWTRGLPAALGRRPGRVS